MHKNALGGSQFRVRPYTLSQLYATADHDAVRSRTAIAVSLQQPVGRHALNTSPATKATSRHSQSSFATLHFEAFGRSIE
jgi:hypothetical protein